MKDRALLLLQLITNNKIFRKKFINYLHSVTKFELIANNDKRALCDMILNIINVITISKDTVFFLFFLLIKLGLMT